MGVRTFDRIPVLINIQIKYNDHVYDGTLINMSEHGMFIRTNKMPNQYDSEIEIDIPVKKEVIHVSGKPVRKVNIRGYYDAVGVEVSNPTQEYLDFFDNLLAVL